MVFQCFVYNSTIVFCGSLLASMVSNGFWKSEQRLEDKPVGYTLNRISLGPYTGKIHQTNVQWSNGGMETIHRYGFSASIKVLNSGLGPF